MRSVVAVVVAMIMQTTGAHAQAVNTIGAGTSSSCGTWLAQRQHDNFFGMINWALGYISGAAVYGDIGNPLGQTDADGVVYWLDNYCHNYPSGYFSAAVKAFISA